jgi:hypothetical protein
LAKKIEEMDRTDEQKLFLNASVAILNSSLNTIVSLLYFFLAEYVVEFENHA